MELNLRPEEGGNGSNGMPRGIVDKFMTDHSNDPYFIKLLADARQSFEESYLGLDEE